MEPRFKVGDTVYIKQLSELEFRPPFSINKQMYCYSGKKAKITAINADKYSITDECAPKSMLDGAKYILDIDDGRWSWSLPMLLKVSKDISIKVAKKSIKFNFSN